MRVLMLDGGDRTPYLSWLVARLSQLGVEMHYAADPRWKDFRALEEAAVRCHPLRVRHKLDFPARHRIRVLLDEHRIEVLHTITGRDAYVGLQARRRRPVRTLVRRGAYPKMSRFDPVDRLVYGRKGADRFVTTSRDLAAHLTRRGVAPGRVTAVYTGVWGGAPVPETRDLRRENGIADGVFLFGLVGKLRPVKGFDLLLDALAILAKREAPFRLLVAGEGYERELGRIRARGLEDRVTLLGHQDGVLPFTLGLDSMVVSSRIDAAPRAVIEATVLGTPVIATRVGGIPEILDDGRAGVLVEPSDPTDLAAAMERAIDDPSSLRALAEAAKPRNRDLFSVDRCASRHAEIYNQLLTATAAPK